MEALSFQLDPYSAREMAKVYALAKGKQGSLLSKSLWHPISLEPRLLLGIAGPADRVEAVLQVEKMEAVYLSFWIVDASIELQVEGNGSTEPAVASLASRKSRMPGFDRPCHGGVG